MKLKWIGSALALGALAFLSVERSAIAAPSAAATNSSSPKSACLDACFRNYTKSVARCQKVCFVCTYSVFGFCIEGHLNEECFEYCEDLAKEVREACAQGC